MLGCAARLLNLSLFRIGSERYVQANGSYGLTTLLCDHVALRRGSELEFCYRGKSGRDLSVTVADSEVHRVVRALLRGRDPKEKLLVHRDGRSTRELHADDLNA